MKTVEVSQTELLAKLITNRELHVTDFNEALAGYKVQVKKRVEEILAKVNEGQFDDLNIRLAEPTSYEKTYDRAIAMLRMSVDDTVTLTDVEFQQFVLDEWTWKQNVTTLNAAYKSSL